MSAQMRIVVTCRTCGREFEPGREDYVRGVWRTCPACRAGKGERNDDRERN